MTAGRHVTVEADGGARGNPGPAGYGAVVLGPDGEVLAERQGGLGTTTNNVAEYTGLIEGLRAAAEVGAGSVDVRLDSKLVVEQMNGRWRIKNETLRPLAARAAELAAGFERVTYSWIARERNTRADALANEAMDRQADGAQPEADEAGDARAPCEAGTSGEQPAGGSGEGGDVEGDTQARQGALFADTCGTDRAVKPAPATWSGAAGAPTRLYLLRHGQTELSADRRYSGRGDVPLTELGAWQASAAAKRLSGLLPGESGGSVSVIASPLRRAVATAEAVTGMLGGSVRTHDGLLETDFGRWEGLTFSEAAERDPRLHRAWLGDATIEPPGGESFEQVHRRVRGVLDELLDARAGQEVVVVSHVTPIKSVLRLALAGGPELLYRIHLDLASLSIVEFYPDGNASVRLVNDTSYLA
ncbi:bifunctional RNase H/acid phosphatase [Haloechinothrix sp. LS1_15]|uniref:bifunctional RNase H/acid phosphatase n=1 Tax=Haloechinothrix sp. LS1_15 TaxID=2652248 RepID=UPI00294721E9|nr:bifunctional RNase H/acid phosphatase [Haloechinothrix sp. LS1_15]MDV6013824.1 bifunctional RNase H/acid phosphatase [Haloechinothrix sp. LS1_15]